MYCMEPASLAHAYVLAELSICVLYSYAYAADGRLTYREPWTARSQAEHVSCGAADLLDTGMRAGKDTDRVHFNSEA